MPIVFLILLGVAVNIITPKANAAIPGTAVAASVYEVTVKKVELCTDATCTSPLILADTSKSFDIAGAAAGAAVGSFARANGLPIGTTFTHVRVSLDETITMIGGGTDEDVTCFTDATPAQNGDANTADISNNTTTPGERADYVIPSDAGDFTGLVDADWTNNNIAVRNTNADSAGDVLITFPLTAPFTSTAQEPTIAIKFDTSAALGVFDSNGATGGGDCIIFPRPPIVKITISN